MNFVTWNLASGGSEAAWKLLSEMRADVAFVQEAQHQKLPALALWNGVARRNGGAPQYWGSAIIPSSSVVLRPLPATRRHGPLSRRILRRPSRTLKA